MKFTIRLSCRRQRREQLLTVGLDYNKRTTQAATTTDRLFFDNRLERLFERTSWSVFFHETVEYDEFQPFDVRDTSDAGTATE